MGIDASGDIAAGENHLYVSSFHKDFLQRSFINRFLFQWHIQDRSFFIVNDDTTSAVGLAVDGTNLYWTDPITATLDARI